MLRLITLDATNTIIKFRKPAGQQYAAIGRLYGLNPDVNSLNQAFRSTFKKLEQESPNFGSGSIGWQKWWLSLVSGTFKGAECTTDEALLKTVGHHLIRHFSSAAAYELYDGSVPLLELISGQRVKLGVISNTDQRLEGILIELGIRHYFDFILTSYSAEASKPDARIFRQALTLAGNNSPSSALHIGDDLRKDYLGAKSCGWDSILVSDNCQSVCEESGLKYDKASMFRSLKELMPVLETKFEEGASEN